MSIHSTPDVVCELISAKTIRLFREIEEISSHTTSGDCAISRHVIQTKAVHRRTPAPLSGHKLKEMAINRIKKPHKIYGNNDTLKAR